MNTYTNLKYTRLPFDQDLIQEIVQGLESEGVFCLEAFLNKETLLALQEEALELKSFSSKTTKANNHKYAVKGEVLKGTLLEKVFMSQQFFGTISEVIKKSKDVPANLEASLKIDNLKFGLAFKQEANDRTSFHFDDSFLNFIIPLFVPQIDGERRGQLHYWPNIRTFKKNLWSSFVVPSLCRLKAHKFFFEEKEIDYRPGNAYLFYGRRTLHGVKPMEADGLRCIVNALVSFQ